MAGLIANQIGNGIDISQSGYVPATYSAATTGPVTNWNVDANQLASNQSQTLMADNSPMQQQARTAGLQQANSNGMLNSSIGITAAQSAAYTAALPLATADASMYGNAAKSNADASNQFSTFNAAQQNAASAANAASQNAWATSQAQNQNSQTLADKSTASSAYLAGLSNTNSQALADKSNASNLNLANLGYENSQTLADKSNASSLNLANLGYENSQTLADKSSASATNLAGLSNVNSQTLADKTTANSQTLAGLQNANSQALADKNNTSNLNLANLGYANSQTLADKSSASATNLAGLSNVNSQTLADKTAANSQTLAGLQNTNSQLLTDKNNENAVLISKAAQGTQVQIAGMDSATKLQAQTLQNNNAQLLQSNAAAAQLFQTVSSAINNITNNPNMDATAKTAASAAAWSNLQGQLSALNQTSSLNLADIINGNPYASQVVANASPGVQSQSAVSTYGPTYESTGGA